MARPRRKALKPGNFKTLNVLVPTSAYDYVVSHMDVNGFKGVCYRPHVNVQVSIVRGEFGSVTACSVQEPQPDGRTCKRAATHGVVICSVRGRCKGR